MVFYTAVQAIDAVIAYEDLPVSNHEGRFAAIAATIRLQKVGTLYHPLYDLCRKVRYTASPDVWVPPALIDKQIIRGLLLPLEKSVLGLIDSNLKLDPIELSWTGTEATKPAPH